MTTRRAARAGATTRGGWTPTGTSAARRAAMVADLGPKATRTRQRILDAARAVAARRGYFDTTVEQIIEEAGVSRGSFYTYFDSREDLFRQLVAVVDEQVDRRVVGVERDGNDPVATLRRANRNYFAIVREHADLYRLVDQVAASDDTARRNRQRTRQRHAARVAETIRRWQARGIADASIDPDAVAFALVSMLSSAAHSIYVDGEGAAPRRTVDTLTDVWIRACGLRLPESG